MCGIVAFFAHGDAAEPVSREEVRRVRDHMRPRGPDGEGEWFSQDGRVGLAHRRLAIIDLTDDAAQPMATPDGRYHVVYNGEIYNYRALRAELEAEGVIFRSHSDTEVLLHLFAKEGAGCVHRLRGMFALAIWDAEERSLFLARDPYGIKPLYYADCNGTVRVASQVKALLSGGRISRDPCPAGLVGFLCWGSVPEPATTYKAIRALPAGSYLWVDHRGVGAPCRYWAPRDVYDGQAERIRRLPSSGATEEVRGALEASVSAHLEADVPVAVFLSAGIDSSALASLVAQAAGSKVTTVTLAFEEYAGRVEDESRLARQTAERLGTDHRTVTISKADFDAELPRIWASMDQPTIDGINTYFVARAAAQEGFKVALSGVGGDELFGGYPSFRRVPLWQRTVGALSHLPGMHRLTRPLPGLLAGHLPARINPKLAGLLSYASSLPGAYLLQRALYLPEELRAALLDPDLVHAGLSRYDPLEDVTLQAPKGAPPVGVVAALEQSFYMRNQLLRDADCAGMAHSLEIRVPLVDRFLTEAVADHAVAAWDARRPKHLLATAPQPPLPPEVTDRGKTGFSIPVSKWMQSLLPSSSPSGPWARPWSRVVLEQVYREHA